MRWDCFIDIGRIIAVSLFKLSFQNVILFCRYFSKEKKMSIRWLSVTCCSNFFKNFQKLHNVCPPHQKLHVLSNKQCKTFFDKVAKGNRVLLCRQYTPEQIQKGKTTVMYLCATGIFMLGMSYAAVPLYRIFCQASYNFSLWC